MDTIQQKSKTTPKDFFINLGVIFMLYFLVINTIILLFDTIDTAFPRTIAESFNNIPEISFQLAALIVGFPFFLYLSYVLYKGEEAEPLRKELGLHKWLTFLTLFVAGITIVIDLIVLLSTFLRGDEILIGFILKVLAILIVAGAVFGYYLIDLQYHGARQFKKYFAYGSGIFVVLAISAGFMVFGSPSTQKAKRFDNDRISGLQSIQYQILDYWQNKKTVPVTLKDLGDPIGGFMTPADPRTGQAYEYQKISDVSFKLCAIFEREGNTQNVGIGKTVPVPIPLSSDINSNLPNYWTHGIGTVCYERTIDPTRYDTKPIFQ